MNRARDAGLAATLAARLSDRREQGLYRSRVTLDGPQGARVRVDGRDLVAFCSNDYLGLAAHPRLAEAMQRGAARWGTGSGASHLVTGHLAVHEALEAELAAFLGAPRALLFSTGYMANLGVIGALAGRGDVVAEDRLNHASLLDGGLLCGARLRRYRHADDGDAARALEGARAGAVLATDGVFSMDGDIAPLPALLDVARRCDAWLYVDDAHGLGVTGPGGRGTPAAFGIPPGGRVVVLGTLGKALGSFGAFVAAEEEVIETLIQHARPYVYTTALPPAVAEATREALRLVDEEAWRREHLLSLVERFRDGARRLGLSLTDSRTPIQPLVLGRPETAVAASEALARRGFLVTPIRPPTVPAGSARLRVTLSAAHASADVDALLEALASLPQLAGAREVSA